MVIRILTGKSVAGAVRYNEQKVGTGQAERIQVANYPNRDLAMRNAEFRLHLLEHQARLNPAIRKSAVHLAVAFHPAETLTNEQVRLIGNRVMREAGYGNQPYLMYRHHDTDHPHIHIVTVAVDGNGRKVNDSFLKARLNKARRGLELEYGLRQAEGQKGDVLKRAGMSQEGEEFATIAQVVEQTLTRFTVGSLDAIKQYLVIQGVKMSLGMGRSRRGVQYQKISDEGPVGRPIAASALDAKPTRRKLLNQIALNEPLHRRNREVVVQTIHQQINRFVSISEVEFKQALWQAGIQILKGKDGYIYVQERLGVILLDKELEGSLWKTSLQERFTQNAERRPLPQTNGVGQKEEGQGRLEQKALKRRVAELQTQAGEKKPKPVTRWQTQPVDKERKNGFDGKVVATDVSDSNPQLEPIIQPEFTKASKGRNNTDPLKKNSRKKGPRL